MFAKFLQEQNFNPFYDVIFLIFHKTIEIGEEDPSHFAIPIRINVKC